MSLTTRFLPTAAAGSVVAALVLAPAASAHDRLLSSNPAANATVQAAPKQLEFTFSAKVLEMGGEVAIKAPSGGTVNYQPAVSGPKATTPFKPAGNGNYTVTWRVTSSDGHPISGSYTFVLKDPSLANNTPAPVNKAPTTTSTVKGPTTPTTDEPGDNQPALIIGGSVLLAALLIGGGIVASRRVKGDPS